MACEGGGTDWGTDCGTDCGTDWGTDCGTDWDRGWLIGCCMAKSMVCVCVCVWVWVWVWVWVAPSCTPEATGCTGCAMGWGTAALIGVAVWTTWDAVIDWLDDVIESEDEAAARVGDSEVDEEVVTDMEGPAAPGTA